MESASCLADNVEKAHARLQAWRNRRPDSIIWTPLLQSRSWLECKGGGGAPVFIKCESDQITGSFKLRGAINAITIAVENNANEAIFVTASTGNHGLAVAHALELVKLRSTGRIYMPRTVKATKVAQLETYGRTVSIQKVQSDDCLDAELAAGRFAKCTPGTIYLSPCNNYDVIAGQGTVAVEILHTLRVISEDIEQDLFTAGTLYATVGGGGLISGIAAFMKLRAPRWRIVGCQPKNSAAMYASVKAGNVVDVATKPTLSDGSAGGLEHDCLPLWYCRTLVDDWILVDEDEIASAVREMAEHCHKIIEGSAGVALAAFLKDRARDRSLPAVVVACGSNIGLENLAMLYGRS